MLPSIENEKKALMRLSVLLLVGLAAVTGCTSTGGAVDSLASTSPSAANSSPVTSVPDPSAELQFVLDDEIHTGDTVRFRMKNVGDRAYIYRSTYAACELTYTDGDGREFLIPPGTHCDLLSEATIKPGQTVALFKWRLNECVEDRFGCMRSEALLPGDYTITGQFSPVDKGKPINVAASFSLVVA